MRYKIFVIDDDLWSSKKIKHILNMNPDHDVSLYSDPFKLLKDLSKKPDLVCVDFLMPKMDGKQLIDKIFKINPNQDILVISGQSNIPVVIDLLKAGVKDYIIKTEDLKNSLWKSVNNIKEKKKLTNEIKSLKKQLRNKSLQKADIIGKDLSIKLLNAHIEKAASTNINICITGETGTGKELVAKSIFNSAVNLSGEFVSINMSAIPSDLLESELFGHEKGAFTGADQRKIGLFEKANNGILFLDEIAEINFELQAKLLRAIEERKIRRLGGNELINVNFKLVTATHKDLTKLIKQNKFREDLYYRIFGFPIHLIPLRDRRNDIPVLSEYFINSLAKQNNKKIPIIQDDAIKKLGNYTFPGNIRELKSIIELACVLCEDYIIKAKDIRLPNVRKTPFTEEKTLNEYNNEIIQYYLDKYNFNVKKVAQLLDIGVSTIYYLAKNNRIHLK